jgi:hypothetical protein
MPKRLRTTAAMSVCLLFLAGSASLAEVNPSPLDVGYRQM